jgi:hypothetical protein
MKQRILIALLTIVVVAAGFFAGRWAERNSCKIPKPPRLLGELSPQKQDDSGVQPKPPKVNVAGLAAEIERLRPQVAHFRERMLELDREMDGEILAILNPAQRQIFEGLIKKYAAIREKEDAALQTDRPLTTQEIVRLQQDPLYKMLEIVVVPMRLEWSIHDLGLDPAQQEQIRKILEGRRQKFLELVDSSPPPSLKLSKLVPIAQRLVPEKSEKK